MATFCQYVTSQYFLLNQKKKPKIKNFLTKAVQKLKISLENHTTTSKNTNLSFLQDKKLFLALIKRKSQQLYAEYLTLASKKKKKSSFHHIKMDATRGRIIKNRYRSDTFIIGSEKNPLTEICQKPVSH